MRIRRTFVALALAAPLIAVVAPAAPIAVAATTCDLGNGIEHVGRDHVRQRALLPGQPQRALGPRADADT